jgi:hypothetical protein
MISLNLSARLPLANDSDIGASSQVQVAPGIAGNLHSDLYYTQRDHERQTKLTRIHSERVKDQRRRDNYDKQPVRGPGSLAIWLDTPAQDTRRRQNLQNQQVAHEQVRVAQEQKLHEEETQDRAEQKQ